MNMARLQWGLWRSGSRSDDGVDDGNCRCDGVGDYDVEEWIKVHDRGKQWNVVFHSCPLAKLRGGEGNTFFNIQHNMTYTAWIGTLNDKIDQNSSHVTLLVMFIFIFIVIHHRSSNPKQLEEKVTDYVSHPFEKPEKKFLCRIHRVQRRPAAEE